MMAQFTFSRKSGKSKAGLEGELSIHMLAKGGKGISEGMNRTYKSIHGVCWENVLRSPYMANGGIGVASVRDHGQIMKDPG